MKFGGASVKNAAAIRHLLDILIHENHENYCLIISAMDKTTNALEELLDEKLSEEKALDAFKEIKDFHYQQAIDLLDGDEGLIEATSYARLFRELKAELLSARLKLAAHPNHSVTFDEQYDRIVSYGEILSTKLVHTFLVSRGQNIEWLYAPKYVITDVNHRNAGVDWENTNKRIADLDQNKNYLSQGFIGSSISGSLTTLGREGSDYSAAIFSYGFNASSMTVWKDVSGIYNADPKLYRGAEVYTGISYEDATEMTYYGAKVIHPKTLRPLYEKQIRLCVKSFLNPALLGTIIDNRRTSNNTPTFIIKENQCLVSLQTKNLDLINEGSISYIYRMLFQLRIRVNVLQISALSFSFSFDYDERRLKEIIANFEVDYFVRYNDHLQMLTVRNYQSDQLSNFYDNYEVLLEQRSRNVVQFVTKNKLNLNDVF